MQIDNISGMLLRGKIYCLALFLSLSFQSGRCCRVPIPFFFSFFDKRRERERQRERNTHTDREREREREREEREREERERERNTHRQRGEKENVCMCVCVCSRTCHNKWLQNSMAHRKKKHRKALYLIRVSSTMDAQLSKRSSLYMVNSTRSIHSRLSVSWTHMFGLVLPIKPIQTRKAKYSFSTRGLYW